MIVAVLDTNVLVSVFPARDTVPAMLIDAWRQGAFQLVISEAILEELAETWRDPCWRARYGSAESAGSHCAPSHGGDHGDVDRRGCGGGFTPRG